ncbi:MAG: GRP family sugar transporter [Armatimonadetes bacterium]|nr:GRP family sugar transporter [Armatimonadota bacterium]
MDWLGYGLATLALVFFGLYMVPRKLTGMRDRPFVLSMSVGIVLTTTLCSLLVHHTPLVTSHPGALYALACGPLWFIGILLYSVSVSEMGLTLSTPIKNTTAVLGTLVGLIVFAEWRETKPLEAVLGSLLVVVSAVIISRTGENDCRRSCLSVKGTLAALGAACGFAAYTLPLKYAQRLGLDTITLVAIMGWGIIATAALAYAVSHHRWRDWWGHPRREHGYALLCGAIWVVATYAMSEAILRIGLAITWPFTNLNTIVTVACGILFFHEINVRKFWRVLLLGLAVGVIGVGLLGLARL